MNASRDIAALASIAKAIAAAGRVNASVAAGLLEAAKTWPVSTRQVDVATDTYLRSSATPGETLAQVAARLAGQGDRLLGLLHAARQSATGLGGGGRPFANGGTDQVASGPTCLT